MITAWDFIYSLQNKWDVTHYHSFKDLSLFSLQLPSSSFLLRERDLLVQPQLTLTPYSCCKDCAAKTIAFSLGQAFEAPYFYKATNTTGCYRNLRDCCSSQHNSFSPDVDQVLLCRNAIQGARPAKLSSAAWVQQGEGGPLQKGGLCCIRKASLGSSCCQVNSQFPFLVRHREGLLEWL